MLVSGVGMVGESNAKSLQLQWQVEAMVRRVTAFPFCKHGVASACGICAGLDDVARRTRSRRLRLYSDRSRSVYRA